MMNKVYFYQNNPCVIVREATSEIVEIQINHKFAESMELKGQCQGCCIGDSDNKIPCTCDEHSWIIEEIQEEEHKLVVMVEKRLLSEQPIEKASIDRFKKLIEKQRAEFESTKALHKEWEVSLKHKRSMFNLVSDELTAMEERKSILESENLEIDGRLSALQSKLHDVMVLISGSSKKISMAHLNDLEKRDQILTALEAGGVGNWEWYDESLKGIRGD